MKETTIKRLLVTGDSLVDATWVLFYHNSQFQHWAEIVSRELGIEVINTGIGGDTITNISKDAVMQDRIFKHKPTHCIIDGGANDIWGGQWTPDQITSCMSKSLQAIKRNGIQPILLWMPVDPKKLELKYNGSTPDCIVALQRLHALYVELAAFLDVPFIDLENTEMGSTPNVNPSLKDWDAVHNNTHGNLFAGGFIVNFLKEHFPSPKPEAIPEFTEGYLQTENSDIFINVTGEKKKIKIMQSAGHSETDATACVKWRY